jgi:hypothetical protein
MQFKEIGSTKVQNAIMNFKLVCSFCGEEATIYYRPDARGLYKFDASLRCHNCENEIELDFSNF